VSLLRDTFRAALDAADERRGQLDEDDQDLLDRLREALDADERPVDLRDVSEVVTGVADLFDKAVDLFGSGAQRRARTPRPARRR
jgi:hypothetical protein